MAKYRRKTDALEAVQWFPPGDARHVPNPLVRVPDSADPDSAFVANARGQIIAVRSGDWIVEEWGTPGRATAVDARTFAHAWEPVPS